MSSRSFTDELTCTQRGLEFICGAIDTDSGGDYDETSVGAGFSVSKTGTGQYTVTMLNSYAGILYANVASSSGSWNVTSTTATTVVFTRYGGGADTRSTGTATCTQAAAVAATDEITIDGVSYASVASAPDVDTGEWLVGASDTEMGVNLTAAINGHTAGAAVTATEDTGVVTVTSDAYGEQGNLAMSETGIGIALSGATLTGGYNAPDAVADLASATLRFFIVAKRV